MQRRRFLQSLCIASVSLLPACKSTKTYYQAQKKSNELMLPKDLVSDLEPFLVTYKDDIIGVARIKNQAGTSQFSASLLNCTHMGCRVETMDGGYICPCHGARFKHNGDVTKGPALTNLTTYPTRSDELNIYIQVNQ